jgi:hypothetical protein
LRPGEISIIIERRGGGESWMGGRRKIPEKQRWKEGKVSTARNSNESPD